MLLLFTFNPNRFAHSDFQHIFIQPNIRIIQNWTSKGFAEFCFDFSLRSGESPTDPELFSANNFIKIFPLIQIPRKALRLADTK